MKPQCPRNSFGKIHVYTDQYIDGEIYRVCKCGAKRKLENADYQYEEETQGGEV